MSTLKLRELIWEIIEFVLHAIAEKDEFDGINERFRFKLSLGRSSWIVWFYCTIYFTVIGIQLSYLWYLIGLSVLGYVIGKKFIVTGISGAIRTEKADWTNEEHP